MGNVISKYLEKYGVEIRHSYNPDSKFENFSLETDSSLEPNDPYHSTVEFKTPFPMSLRD
jgi:hypothetical protein